MEANFGVNENLGELFKLLDGILVESEYFLFIPPFVNKKLSKENKFDSFKQFGLVPDGTLSLLFMNEEFNKKGFQCLKQ